jgi:hypothetical protein
MGPNVQIIERKFVDVVQCSVMIKSSRRTDIIILLYLLRSVFRPKRDEVTDEWRKLHSGELQSLYSPPK